MTLMGRILTDLLSLFVVRRIDEETPFRIGPELISVGANSFAPTGSIHKSGRYY
jgi:hypothetical protein